MDIYRPVLFYISQFVAVFSVASFGTPKLPSSWHLIAALALATLYLCYCGYLYYKDRRMLSTMFAWSCALIPWVFYLELLVLRVNPFTLEGELTGEQLKHVVVVFNLFRYVILALISLTTLKDLLRSLRN